MHSKLTEIFSFIRLVDLNSRIDESQTIRRVSSVKLTSQKIAIEISELLKKFSDSTKNVEYNDKDGYFLKAFNQENNGLSEIIIKFVKFMHRLEVCSLSVFDVFCPKLHDVKVLKVFLWNFNFMQKISKSYVGFNNKSKFNQLAIKQAIDSFERSLQSFYEKRNNFPENCKKQFFSVN